MSYFDVENSTPVHRQEEGQDVAGMHRQGNSRSEHTPPLYFFSRETEGARGQVGGMWADCLESPAQVGGAVLPTALPA